MGLLLALVVAGMVFFGYLAFDQHRLAMKRKESMRARIAPDGTTQTSYHHEEQRHDARNEASPQAKSLMRMLKMMGVNVDESLTKLEARFGQAGLPTVDGPIYYLFFQRVVSLLFCVLGLWLLFAGGTGMAHMFNILAGIMLIGGGLFGPYLYLQNKIDHRKKKLERAFPDTLDLLLICVESGLALDAALTRVCNELGRAFPDMTEELNRTRLELALINDRVRALMNLGERTNMVAFRSLVAALIQSERFGTSLTDTLRVLSEDFRLQRLSQAEAKAARLPVLLTIPLIFLLMPSFMLIVLGPAIVRFARQGQAVTGQ